ncbi:MAG: hypothetical protein LBU32_28990 [Clostridiales bacterium]|jgi:glucan phosphoethanolaminetransferase (alkaline phosphatase superfamily)|nr:hypothetical protein [Clostridiales bacterium]
MRLGLTLFSIIIFLGLGIGSVMLQIFLSKMESRWPGLILPVITVLFSLIAVFNIGVSWEQRATIIIENGRAVSQAAENATDLPVQIAGATAAAIISTFLISNMPTAVYAAIYLSVREKRKREKLLEKMRAQDLG